MSENLGINKPPTVAIIDNYDPYSINPPEGEFFPGVTHGNVNEAIIKAECPAANIKRFKVHEDIFGLHPTEIYQHFKPIKENPDINYVNISIEYNNQMSDIVKDSGMKITKEDFKNSEIITELKAIIDKKSAPASVLIDGIQSIADSGKKVYIGAGNDGLDGINLFSLAKDTNSVGALEKDGKTKAFYSADNPLIHEENWEVGNYDVNAVFDIKGQFRHYELASTDFKTILPDNAVRSKTRKIGNSMKMAGTSFAAPRKLGKDLREKFGPACDF